MQKKIWYVILSILSIFLSACEDTAEKRAKLEAQIAAAEVELNECTYSVPLGKHSLYLEKCGDKQKKWQDLQAQLDELNDVKR